MANTMVRKGKKTNGKAKLSVQQQRQLARIQAMENAIELEGSLSSRLRSLHRYGRQYFDSATGQYNRNLYEAYGYDAELTFDQYVSRYLRQDIAKAIINRPCEATWRGDWTVYESDDDNETPFEKAWSLLYDEMKLKSYFVRLDKLAAIGRYGVLLMGFNDVDSAASLQNPVSVRGKRQLVYLRPMSEDKAKIQKYVDDNKDPRYGLPLLYKINMRNINNDAKEGESTVLVHHSRILHITGELLESEIEGVPMLEAPYNRLYDLEKLVGGSAEMFFRGARPGHQVIIDDDAILTDEVKDDIQDELNEYEHKLRRIIFLQNAKLEALEQQVSNPKEHVDVQIQMISAVTGIPKRILTGSERGELASSQDRDAWLEFVQNRREDFAEPQIVRPFVDAMIKYAVLPDPGEYSVKWPDPFAMSEKEQVEVGKGRAEAVAKLASAPGADEILPPNALLRTLGYDDDEIELIEEERQAVIKEEEEEMAAEAKIRQEVEDEMRQQQSNVPPENAAQGQTTNNL